MKLIWIFLLIIQISLPSFAQRVNDSTVFPGAYAPTNYIKNPSAHKNATIGTATSSATLTRDTDAADKLDGISSFICDSSAQNGYCEWTTNTIQEGDKTGNCAATAQFKGDASLYKLQVTDGSNVVNSSSVLSSQSDWTDVTVNYPCGSTRTVRFTQTEAGTGAAVNIGRIQWTRAQNVASTNAVGDLGTETWTDDQANATTSVQISRNGNLVKVIGKTTFTGAMSGATNITIPTNYTPDATLYSAPAGSDPYLLGLVYFNDPGASVAVGFVDYTTAGSLRLLVGTTASSYLSGTNTTNLVPHTWASGDVIKWTAEWKVSGWTSSTAYTADQAAWRVDANISGANPSPSGSSQSAYIGIENGSLTLTQNTGSATAWIPCSTTNDSSGTTCSAGSESVGVSFTIPKAGAYKACAEFTHVVSDNGAATNANVDITWQLVETPNAAQTISQEGKSRIKSGLTTQSVGGEERLYVLSPVNVCGTFEFTSSGRKTVRLMYEQVISGTVAANAIYADAAGSNGQRDIHFTVEPINQQSPAPLLVNSVASSSAGVERIERGFMAGCTSTPCTVNSQSGSWITSLTRASIGNYTINIAAGTFSAAPTCVFTGEGLANSFFMVLASSATSVNFLARNITSEANEDADASFICMGAK